MKFRARVTSSSVYETAILPSSPVACSPTEADVLRVSLVDHPLEAGESAAGDEADVLGRHHRLGRVVRMRVLQGTGISMDSSILRSSRVNAESGNVLGGPCPGEDRAVLPGKGELVELIEADDPYGRVGDAHVRRIEEPRENGVDVLADVAGLREARHVDDDSRQPQDVSKKDFNEVRLSAAVRADEKHGGLGRQVLPPGCGPDSSQPADMAMCAEGYCADRLQLADVPAGSYVRLDLARKKHGNGSHEGRDFLLEALRPSALLARCEDGDLLPVAYSVLSPGLPRQ